MKNKIAIGLFVFCGVFSLNVNASIPKEKQYMTKRFSDIATDYERQLFQQFPELGLFWGKTDIPLDRFTNFSEESFAHWHQLEDEYLSELNAINVDSLDASQKITYKLLKETLENQKVSRICKEELWDINPTFGWHNKLAIVAEKQPVGDAQMRELALKRWNTFPDVVTQQIANLEKGIELGYTAPKPAVKRVMTQIQMIVQGNIEDSPYYSFALRDNDPIFKKEITSLVKGKINPSLQHYLTYLEETYLPQAREEIGVSALPKGEICYQAKIKQETTLNKTPAEIHELGLQYMQALNRQVGEIGLRRFGTAEMADVFKLAKKESTDYFSSEQAILDYNVAALKRAQKEAPNWFDLMPQTPGIVKPYPLHRAKTGASGEYHPPSDDGKDPGIFYINTYEPQNRSRIDQEATLFHELIPGHHFQIALQYEDPSIPHLNRYLWNSGYGEGWALYVERLADEMGLYDDDISRLGMLSNESLRASRLVVDTGIHVMNWNRQQAVDYLMQHTAISENIIQGEVDRYIMMPGQATSYMLGKIEIESLRRLAKDKLGQQFDIRKFHNQILKNGVVTLPMLREQVENWIAEQ